MDSATPCSSDDASSAMTLADDQAPSAKDAADIAPGSMLGRYVVTGVLGSGGMATVYAAQDPDLGRRVALKMLRVRGASVGDAARRERLFREAQALALLSHPNVVAVHDVGITDAGVFIAMELVEGATLRRWLGARPAAWERIAPVFLAAGEGLAAAHRAGLVHRDFKPDNVIVGDDQRVRVLDFGLARTSAGDAPSSERRAPVAGNTAEVPPSLGSMSAPLTHDGALLGTPEYMAPEQLAGQPADARSDQFAFCVTILEALYGRRPSAFRRRGGEDGPGGSEVDALEARGRFAVPAHVRKALRRGLSVDPAERHGTMEDLLRELARDPLRRVRRGLAFAASAAVAAALAAVVAVRSRPSPAALCIAGEGRAADVWGPEARGRIRAVFAGVPRPYAADALARVEAGLDAYVAAWARGHRDACEATYVRAEQSADLFDLRMACLAGHLGEVRAQVAVFASADEATVQRAASTVQLLPRLDECSDVPRLRGGPPVPASAEERTRRATLTDHLARARALQLSGRVDETEKELEAFEALRNGQPAPGLLAASQLLRGKVESARGNQEAASATFWGASLQALAEGDSERAAESWIHLTLVVGDRMHRFEDAERYSALAQAALQHVPRAEALRAALLRNRGALLNAEGKAAEALPVIEEALARMLAAVGKSHPNYASTLETLGNVQKERGEYELAVAAYREVVALREALYGPHHPIVATSLTNLGRSLGLAGHAALGESACQRALTILEAAGGRQLSGIDTLACLGEQRRRLGDAKSAWGFDERMLAEAKRSRGEDSLDVAYGYQGLALDALALHQPAVALENARASLAVMQRNLPPGHPERETAQGVLADCLFEAGFPAQALAVVREARAAMANGPPETRGAMWLHEGRALAALGRRAEAAAAFDESVTLLEQRPGLDPRGLALARAERARLNVVDRNGTSPGGRVAHATVRAPKGPPP